jgi:2-dehydro-3-deoxyphosphogluconate aldolase / (4S)-4-hydroxy-2-oxoglutarate aldolase
MNKGPDQRPPLPPALEPCPVIAILRRVQPDHAEELVGVLSDVGIRAVELTMDSPGMPALCRTLRRDHPEMTIGAGTVLDIEQARAALEAGAAFLVSPHTDPDLIRFACGAGVPALPGAATPTEALTAWKAGAAAVKLFPASVLGTAMLDALRDPLPHVRVVAVGGITDRNAAEFLAHGAVAIAIGSWLSSCPPAEARERATRLLTAVSQAKSGSDHDADIPARELAR